MFLIQININSFKFLDSKKIIKKMKKIQIFKKIKIKGPILKKQKKTVYTVLKSPHIFKKSREHFIKKKYNHMYIFENKNLLKLLYLINLLKKNIPNNCLTNIKLKCL